MTIRLCMRKDCVALFMFVSCLIRFVIRNKQFMDNYVAENTVEITITVGVIFYNFRLGSIRHEAQLVLCVVIFESRTTQVQFKMCNCGKIKMLVYFC